MQPQPKTLGSVRLLQLLGTDGVAETYTGLSSADLPVVVRRLLSPLARDPVRAAAVLSRAQDLMAVQHSNLVRVLEVLREGDELWVVEEAIEGASLARLLTAGAPLPPPLVLHIATQICNALEALHSRPSATGDEDFILHLGLRPDAVVLTADARLAVGGYGLLRSPMAGAPGGLANADRVAYLSPEQSYPDQRLSPSSDLFSLGALLFELCTGEPLFRKDSALQTVQEIRRAEVSGLLGRARSRIPGIERVLSRSLNLNPRHRYQRAFVLREDLRGLMVAYTYADLQETISELVTDAIHREPEPARERPPSRLAAPRNMPPSLLPLEEVTDTAIGLMAQGAVDEAPSGEVPLHTLEDSLLPEEEGEHSAAAAEAQLRVATARRDDPEATEQGARAIWDVANVVDRVPEGIQRTLEPAPVDEDALFDFGEEEAEPPPRPPSRQPAPPAPPPAPTPPAAPAPPSAAKLSAEGADLPPDDESSLSLSIADPSLVMRLEEAGLDLDSVKARDRELRKRAEEELAAARGDPPPPPVVPLPVTPPPPPKLPPSRSPAGPPITLFMLPTAQDATFAAPGTSPLGTPAAAPPAAPPAAPAPTPVQAAVQAPTLAPVLTPAPAPAQTARPAPAPAPSVPPALPKSVVPRSITPQDSPRRPPAASPPATPPPQKRSAQTREVEDEAPRARRAGPSLVPVIAGMVGLGVLCGVGLYGVAPRLGAWMGESTPEEELLGKAPTAPEPAPPAAPVEFAPEPAAEAPPAPPQVEPTAETAPVVAAAPEPAPARVPEQAAPVRVAPAPVAPTRISPAPVASASTPVARSAEPAATRSVERTAPPASTRTAPAPAAVEEDAIVDASLDLAAPEESAGPQNLDRYAGSSAKGKLTSSDILALETVETDDPSYSRARALLLMDAERKGNATATRQYLDDLLAVPENRYNPLYLTENARYYVNQGQYEMALRDAQKAERYWARLPSDLVFAKKAEIYEIQAAAAQGLFYRSGDDMQLLDQAIRDWERYREHVATRGRVDLSARADKELSKLEDFRARLQ